MKSLASRGRRRGGWARLGQPEARAVLWSVIALCALLPPLAAASPPDPTWIAGFYDENDFDDVVIGIGLWAGVCDWSGPPALAFGSHLRRLALPGVPPVVCVTRCTLQDRSPPLL